MADPRVLGIVLAGGAGTRLAPLTDDRAKRSEERRVGKECW